MSLSITDHTHQCIACAHPYTPVGSDENCPVCNCDGTQEMAGKLRAVNDGPYQRRVGDWMAACFGEVISNDRSERNHRFLEEALELVQACGCSAADAHALVDYTFGRAVGEKSQEVGGVMVTLAALCNAQALDLHVAAERELARVWTKVDVIREKQLMKPKIGPLPGAYPERVPLPAPGGMQRPIAWVPVHPREGELWAMTTNDPSPERLPVSYPLRALYGNPLADDKAFFSPSRLPAPDAEGFFAHPDVYTVCGDDEPDEDEMARRLARLGWELQYTSGEDLVDPDTLEYDVRTWRPEPWKPGEGWRLVSVLDTEDGPYAMFVRPMSTDPRESDAARVCAAAYQGAGACEWPEEWLDILSDGASGEPLRHDPMSLLPFKLAEVPAQPQQIERLRGLDTEQRVRFYEHDFYVLSNFSAFNLIWRGQTFLNSEAAYHYEKFSFTLPDGTTSNAIQNQVAQDILRAPSAHEAYKVAERNKALRRPDWDAVKFDRMKEILWAKVRQHEYVLRKLMATGDRELVEDSWRDDVWGWGPNRDGENRLGRLWMEIRASIRAGEASIVPLRTDETPIDPPGESSNAGEWLAA